MSLDSRQTDYRGILSQLFPYISDQTLDILLQSIDSDVSSLLRVDATGTPSLVVNVGPGTISNPESNRQRSIPFVNSSIPAFSGGTVTFPSASGGNITASPGTTYVLTLPSNDYVQILLALDSSGNILVSIGTPNATESAAIVPSPLNNTLPFAYITLFNNAGTIQNVTQNNIFQFVLGGSGGGGGNVFLDSQFEIENASDTTKVLNFDASAIGTGTTRTVKMANENINLQSIPDLQALMGAGFQPFVDTTTNLIEPTLTTGTPASGFFYSSITNRASMPDLSKNLKAQMGVNRIMTQNGSASQTEFGPAGQPVYIIQNDKFGLIRAVGSGWEFPIDSSGNAVSSNLTGDYIEITFYGTGLNLLDQVDGLSRSYNVSVDGGSPTTNALTGSVVLNARNYSMNVPRNMVSGLTLGIHTVTIENNGPGLTVFGYEVLNESSNILVNPGIAYNAGKATTSATQSSFAYNSMVSGTTGGRVLVYQNPDGSIGSAFTPTAASPSYFNSANHSNEEIVRTFNVTEFGAGRSDDFSTNGSGAITRTFTLDDGTTTLTLNGNNVFVVGNNAGIDGLGGNGILNITFVGTGLDVFLGGVLSSIGTNIISVDGGSSIGTFGTAAFAPRFQTIVSGLPYGTDTVTFTSTSSGAAALDFNQFIVYQPKTPALPSNTVQLATYNVMANFATDSSPMGFTVPAGALRKMNTREFQYTGSGWTTTIDGSTSNGYEVYSNSSGVTTSYTFFGTGISYVFRTNNSGVSNQTITIDGSSNLSGFTTSANGTGVASFTPSTGVFTTSTTNTWNNITITGLSLGIHIITITVNSISSNGNFPDAFDVVTPIHSYKSNLPGDVQNTLMVGSQSIGDLRLFTPLKDQQAQVKNWAQVDGVGSPTTSTSTFTPLPGMNCTIQTNGGDILISYNIGAINESSTQVSTQIYVDGIAVAPGLSAYTPSPYNAILNQIWRQSVSPGVHQVAIYWSSEAGTSLAGDRNMLVMEV